MTKKQIYQLGAVIVSIMTIIAVTVCAIYMPPVAPFVALFGASVISWSVGSALSTVSTMVVEQVAAPEPNIVSIGVQEHERHVHTMIFRTHMSGTDSKGNHMSQNTEQIETNDDGPDRPGP